MQSSAPPVRPYSKRLSFLSGAADRWRHLRRSPLFAQAVRSAVITLCVASLAALQASCSSVQVSHASFEPVAPGSIELGSVATSVAECIDRLSASRDDATPGIGMPIELLSWNVQKGASDEWRSDLRNLASGKEFVTLQEVVLEAGAVTELPHLAHMTFGKGYSTQSKTTGVATFSRSAPLSECHLVATEPLLRTPKAMSVSEYALQESSQTLVVVNLHAVNFTPGLQEFSRQMGQIRQVMQAHTGPAILSGDFNTWSRKRMLLVDELVAELGFSGISLREDDRKRFNGHPLDHIFVRGFTAVSAGTTVVESSDHNPLSIELSI